MTPLILFSTATVSLMIALFFFRKTFLAFGTVFFCSSCFGIAIASSFFAHANSWSMRGGGLREMLVGSEIALPVGQVFLSTGILVIVGGLACKSVLSIFGWSKEAVHSIPFNSDFRKSTSVQFLKYSGLFFYVIYYAQTFPALISRDAYLFIEPGSALGTMRYISPLIGFLAIGFLRSSYSFSFILLFMLSIFNEIALSSRNAAALMAVLVLLVTNRIQNFFFKYFIFFVGVFLTYITFVFLLFSRKTQSYGIGGLVAQLSPFSKDFSTQSLGGGASEVFGNFLSVIPVTYLGLQIPTPESYLPISFNPLFGRDVGWYDIGYLFYVNPWTPSGAVAQVAGLNFSLIFLTWFSVGFLFQANSYLMQAGSSNSFLRTLSFTLPVFATLQFLQYTLRSGMRYVYLWFLVGVLSILYKKLTSSIDRPV